MKIFGIAVFSILLLGVNAIPTCTYNEQKDHLVCSSDGDEYVLEKELIPNKVKVKEIDLNNCRITEIQCDAFSELPALQRLNIADNKLRELKPCILNNMHKPTSVTKTQLNNLQQLDLAGNQLKTLQPGVLDELINLTAINLAHNTINGKNLSLQIFANNKIIGWFDLSSNDMSAAPEDLLQSFQRLYVLILDNCFLTTVPSYATKSNMKPLHQLIMSNNRISSLDDPATFINLENLQILNLDRNLIGKIVANIFAPLKNLNTIVLSNNQLKTISDKWFQNMPKLVDINLSHNEIEVINLASFRNTPMETLNLAGNRLSYMPMNFCDTLTISGGKLKKFLFNDNPWQCACLREILQEVKTHNVAYNSAAYDGKNPVCTTTDNNYMICKRG